jgi:hypothetical protein
VLVQHGREVGREFGQGRGHSIAVRVSLGYKTNVRPAAGPRIAVGLSSSLSGGALPAGSVRPEPLHITMATHPAPVNADAAGDCAAGSRRNGY